MSGARCIVIVRAQMRGKLVVPLFIGVRSSRGLGRIASVAVLSALLASVLVVGTGSKPASAVPTLVQVGDVLAGDFTFLSYGNASLGNSETEGTIAVGGALTMTKGYPVRHTTGLTPSDYDLPVIDGDPTRVFASSVNWTNSHGASDISSAGYIRANQKGYLKLATTSFAANPRGGTGTWVSAPGTPSGTDPGLYIWPEIGQAANDITTANPFADYFDRDLSDALLINTALADTANPVANSVVKTFTAGSHGGARKLTLEEGKVNIVELNSTVDPNLNFNFRIQWGNAVRPSETTPLIFNVTVANGQTVNLPAFDITRANGTNGDPNSSNPNGVAPYTLYNFNTPSASPVSYTIGGTLVSGTIFAPQNDNLSINASSPIEGQIIVNNVTTSGGEFHNYKSKVKVTVDLPPPPGSSTPVDLALKKTVVSMNGTPSNGTVTFRLEVANQGDNPVNGVTVTDYIDTTSFQAMTSIPTGVTTSGAANLPVTWTNASTTAPKAYIAGVIPAHSSVTFDVTLRIATPVKVAGLTNTAEISAFDNDGNAANGDSTTAVNPPVYDVDSIADAVNTDVLVDDEMSLKRWTNDGTTSTQNTSVTDEDDHDIAVVPVYDLALIKTRTSGQAAVITSPASLANPTANFDITVKNQGATAAYNIAVLDTPTAPMSLAGGQPTSRGLTTALGASVTVTYNAASRTYTIPALAAGDSVVIPTTVALDLVNSVQVNTAEISAFDNDADASNAKPSWVQDLDSTPNTNPADDNREVFAGSTFPEDSHNQIDRTPVNGANPSDEDDHDSEAVQLGLLRIGSTVYIDADGDKTGDAGEEVAGVLVQLFRQDAGAWVQVAQTVTNNKGDYSFDKLFPGTYQVGIPAVQSGPGVTATALTDTQPVAGSVAGPETSNFDNDGDAESGFLSRSDDIVLTYGSEPTNDDADDADADTLTSPRIYADENSNLNIDFVFDRFTYELGNLVWLDGGSGAKYDNGIADSGESGIAGVTVELYRDNGAGLGEPNDGILHADERIATAVTDAKGNYTFTGLAAGNDYHVVVVKSSLPAGLGVGGTAVPVGTAPTADNDNNASVDTGLGYASGAVTVGPGQAEPTGEKDGTTGATAAPAPSVPDARADQTVDFGFVPTVRIGNQVWRDESDSSVTTEVPTDNNGIFDAGSGEVGLAGVTVELWLDNGDGNFTVAGDTKVDATVTDAEGNYWFDGVRTGRSYFVVIPSLGGVGPERPVSSTGQSVTATLADNDDDGAPVTDAIAASRLLTPSVGAASLGEADANPAGDGSAETEANAAGTTFADRDSELRVDFGFVNVPLYRIGNLVWLDNGGTPRTDANEANGLADDGETGIAGITVQLFHATDTAFTAPVATTVTDANGHYAFESLVGGSYVVRIENAGTNASLLVGLVATTDGTSADADVDNDSNAFSASGGWASDAVTLGAKNEYMGAEPTDEQLRFDDATGDDNGLSWTAITTDPAVYANSRSNFTVDFGFTPVYRVGNLVWLDGNNDGIAQAGEPGIAGVGVDLINQGTGVSIASTVADADGHYSFENLPAGSYVIRLDGTTIPDGLTLSVVPFGGGDLDIDNDNNGVDAVGVYDASITLGGTEPSTETLRSDDATDDDADAFADDASNLTVDFGFWPQLRIGNVVWIDESDADPSTHAATDNDGFIDAGEALLPGVTVELWLDGGNSVFDGLGGGDDTYIGATVTDAEGNWLFSHLAGGTYFAAIRSLPAGYEAYESSYGAIAGGTDNDDNGAPTVSAGGDPYISVSEPVALVSGNAPTLESDVLPAADGSAEAEADALGMAFRDVDSDLTIDFGFVATPNYRIGNLVWLDANRNGLADAGETGISGVLVQLRDASDVVIAETVTDGDGHYAFEETALAEPIAAGVYQVTIPRDQVQVLGLGLAVDTTALPGLSATLYAGAVAAPSADNDSNGQDLAAGWYSEPFQVGGDANTMESEPTFETLRAGVATDDDLGWSVGTDSRSQFSVDFGFYGGLRLGDTVWFDDGRISAGATDPTLANDGIYQASELPAPGVTVQLFADDGDGVFEPGTGAGKDGVPLQTATTDADGQYFFTGLDELVSYWVTIPASEQSAGGVLEGWSASTPVWSDGLGTNDSNHGAAATGFASVSPLVTLVRGGMEYGDGDGPDEANANTKTSATLADGDSNLVIDFGFAPKPQYRIGNLVWNDADEDGLAGAGETGIAGVSVQLFKDDGDGVFEPGTGTGRDGNPVASDVTGTVGDELGRYGFEGLDAGSYWVYLPVQVALGGYEASLVRNGVANDNIDNDNNAVPDAANGGWTAGLVELGPLGTAGDADEPLAEADGTTLASAEDGTYLDGRSNQTVDFGFAERLRLGNQVWRDESDDDASTTAATDNNGVFDAGSGEVGIAGATVELWRDVNGDGFQGAASDDVLVGSTLTDAEGNYLFAGLRPSTDLYVAISGLGSAGTQVRSSAGQSAGVFDADNDDDGAPAPGYFAVSQAFGIFVGSAPTGEADAVEPGDGSGGPGDASAEDEANASVGFYADANSYLGADFGFVDIPLYRIGNLVWLDKDNDGIAETGEAGIPGVLVQLTTPAGAVIAETVTDADGRYAFENLVAGNYRTRIPALQVATLGSLAVNPAALNNLAGSTVVAAYADGGTDNDNNGAWDGGTWASGVVTLGSSNAAVTETEPTNERQRSGSATDDDSGWANGTDARSDVTVDFGFYQLLRLGDIVWLDNGGNGGAYDAAREDNGRFDTGYEDLIDGVTVVLFKDDGDGVFEPGAGDANVGSTETSGGRYYFTGLTPGAYFAAIPDGEFVAGQELAGLRSSTGQTTSYAQNDRDHGVTVPGWAAVTNVVTLTPGTMVNGDSAFESMADAITGVTVADRSSNLAVDFGFSPVPGYSLGNLVWEDYDNDGRVDSGEPGIGGVTVELYLDVNTNGVRDAGDTLVATDTTGTTGSDAGRYLFEGLAAGDYLVHVPAQTSLTGWFVGGSATIAVDADNDNNALSDAAGGWTAPSVTLGGPAGTTDHDEPVGEADANTGAVASATPRDDRSNQTVDFGFWRGLRLGNQVWLDEGAGDHQDNGVFDADETPIGGLTVSLWRDNGDGVLTSADEWVADTVTSTDGRYYFTGLTEDTYLVGLPAVPASTQSSHGTVGNGLGDDGEDDGAPSGTYAAVTGPLVLTVGGALTGEQDGPGASGGDAEANANAATATYPDVNSFLTADFGVIDVPLYRIGNLVWFDANNDGQAQAGEPALGGVLVQLLDSTGVVIGETVTDASGRYVFTNLAEGTYQVQIPFSQVPVVDVALAASIDADAIKGLWPSTHVATGGTDGDNDANGTEYTSYVRSGLIVLDGSAPVSEQARIDNPADDDNGQMSPRIEDFRSDFSVDFGFYSISLGNLVFLDMDGNGLYEPAAGDIGVAGVPVNLMHLDGTIAQSTTTEASGAYLFTGLRDGEQYYVEIPEAAFEAGGALYGYFSSEGAVGGDLSLAEEDGPDRGVDPSTPFGAVRSYGIITATALTSPTDDGEGDNPDNDSVRPDAAENLIVDFGFYRMELGGTLFVDNDNDGQDTNDGDFSGVTVLLYNADGSPYLLPDGTQYGVTTDAAGNYRFRGLPRGSYILEIPASEFTGTGPLAGWVNSDGNNPVPDVENNLTGEDNGAPLTGDVFSGSAIRSSVLVLNQRGEGVSDPTPSGGYLDSMSNLTVDFGFWHAQAGLELGNQLWFDTVADGVFGPGEKAVPGGVELTLLNADTDAEVATTFTDAQGRYLFSGLAAGRYVVWIKGSNFAPGKPLAGWTSTAGAGVSADPNDELDSDSNALPLTATGVRSAMVVLAAAAPVGEVDAASVGLDDRQSNLTVDFGFVRAPVLVFTGADAAGAVRSAMALMLLGIMLVIGSRRRAQR